MFEAGFVIRFDLYFLLLSGYTLVCLTAPKKLAEVFMWGIIFWIVITAPLNLIVVDTTAVHHAYVLQMALWLIPIGILGIRYELEEEHGYRHILVEAWKRISPGAGINPDAPHHGGPGQHPDQHHHGQNQPPQPQQGQQDDFTSIPDENDFGGIDLEAAVDDIDDFRD